MKDFLMKLIVNTLALLLVVRIVSGVHVNSFYTAILAVGILSIINAALRPIIILLTLPINIFSLGFFTFFINGFIFYAVSQIIEGFRVDNFSSAFWGAIFFSLFSAILNLFFGTKAKSSVKFYNYRQQPKTSHHTVINEDNIIDVQAKDVTKK